MVAPVAGIPILKLGLLAVKQIAKPIANRAKATAKESAVFKSVVVWVGRGLHRTSIQLSRLAEGKVSLEYITPLSETAAVDRGAEFVSEFVIYTIAASTTLYEFGRAQQVTRVGRRSAELWAEAYQLTGMCTRVLTVHSASFGGPNRRCHSQADPRSSSNI
jgi:hypothetical protein